MTATTYVSLQDFAATWADTSERPDWAPPDSESPLPLDNLGLRSRVEDVVDTVVALQRADWLQDGVFVGPRASPDVYRDVLHSARELRVSVPPAILAGGVIKGQLTAGTDARPFLVLSSYYFRTAEEAERRFVTGRLLGHIALRQVTATSLFALIVDHAGVRQVARRAVGPLLEVVLAPIGLGMRLALSRWHRAAEFAADRAGLICADDLNATRTALLRMSLAIKPDIDPQTYLDQIRDVADDQSPGRWAELLASEPWMHKRMKHLAAFAEFREGRIDRDTLEKRTRELLAVG